MWTSTRVNSRVKVCAFILKSRCILSLCRFIKDLPYKSDEMAHVAFPDERYNKHKLTTTRRDEFETLHV